METKKSISLIERTIIIKAYIKLLVVMIFIKDKKSILLKMDIDIISLRIFEKRKKYADILSKVRFKIEKYSGKEFYSIKEFIEESLETKLNYNQLMLITLSTLSLITILSLLFFNIQLFIIINSIASLLFFMFIVFIMFIKAQHRVQKHKERKFFQEHINKLY
jgi:hypothetical protein